MSPRSNHKRRGNRRVKPVEPAPLSSANSLFGMRRSESHPDGEWIVQQVSGSSSGRTYLCPGCQQEVSAAVGHVVTWPVDAPVGSGAGVESRRHWHPACWTRRATRRPR